MSFKVLCFTAAASMLVYWGIEFRRDEDVSLVEITSFGSRQDILQPEVTVCIVQPFLKEKLSNNNSERNIKGYIRYLAGNIKGNEVYNKIVFENVTINLLDHIVNIYVMWKNGTNEVMSTCNDLNDCPFVKFRKSLCTLSSHIILFKCFGMELRHKYADYVNSVILHFNSNLKESLKNAEAVFVTSNYPTQSALIFEGDAIWKNLNKTTEIPWLKFRNVEILRRRQTNTKPCISPDIDYDSFTIEQHIRDVGCRAPYQNTYKNFSICDTKNKMQESIFTVMPLPKKFNVPCQAISSMSYILSSMPDNSWTGEILKTGKISLGITYTKNFKIITQSQKVDLQALIGYIGGYVGLFLGIKCNE